MAMPQELAAILFEKYAFLIVLDAPSNLEFGIDMNVFDVGPRFMGIKLIPPGLHLVYYSLNDTTAVSGGSGDRLGFWHEFKESEVLVRKWSKQTETLEVILDQETINRISLLNNLKSLDGQLGAYPMQETYDSWTIMTKYIALADIKSISGESQECGTSFAGQGVLAYDDDEEALKKAGIKLPQPSNAILEYTQIDVKKSWREGATGTERTRDSLDKTSLLRRTLEKLDPRHLLSEYSIAFVQFLLILSHPSFQQWRNITIMLTFSSEAMSDAALTEELFVPFLDILAHHLELFPETFFQAELSRNNFIATSLETMYRNASHQLHSLEHEEESDIKAIQGLREIKTQLLRMANTIKTRFQWDMSLDDRMDDVEEDDEDQPVIVEI